MPLQFQEKKATQVAARLLKLGGGELPLLKLVKLIYLADRAALVERGKPITMDTFCSLKHGPIVSNTLNLINEQPDEEVPRYWHRFISERTSGYTVRLVAEPESDQLSRFEEQTIDQVFVQFGAMEKYQLRDLTHKLPEWKNPGSSMIPIHLADILLPSGYTEEDVREIESELRYEDEIRASVEA